MKLFPEKSIFARFAAAVFLTTAFLCAAGQTIDNSPWCPKGASWVYAVTSMGYAEYQHYKYSKDTVINGKTVKKMDVTSIRFYTPTARITSVLPPQFYYASNDSLFFMDNGVFRFAWSFNPSVGDKWIVGNSKYPCAAPGSPSIDTVTVTSQGLYNAGGWSFRMFWTNDATRYFKTGTIIKNIGSLQTPFPIANSLKCNSQIDGALGDFSGLVCYEDSIRGKVFTNNSVYDCSKIITSIPVVDERQLQIFPNPAGKELIMKNAAGRWQYQVSNMAGQVVKRGILATSQIMVADLQPGLYIIQLQKGSMHLVSRFVKM